jgi:hypothetical protein
MDSVAGAGADPHGGPAPAEDAERAPEDARQGQHG